MSADFKKRLFPAGAAQARIKWVLLGSLVAVFLFLLYPGMAVRQHLYSLGDIAERDIKAPQDFFVEDKTATAANQQQAIENVLTVYDHDPRIAGQLAERIRTAFRKMQTIIGNLQASTPVAAKAGAADPSGTAGRSFPADEGRQEIEKALSAHKDTFESLIGIDVSRGAYKLLIAESFSPAIAETIIQIMKEITANGVVANKEVLLKEADKGITLRDVSKKTEKTVVTLRQFYGPDQAKTMVRIVAEPLVKDLNYNLVNLIVDLSQRLIHPNITLNHNETEERKKKVLAEIKPVLYRVKAGEMLLREGERISALQLLKLRALENQKEGKRISTTGIGATIILSALLIAYYILFFSQPRFRRLLSDKNLLFLTLVLITTLVMVKIGGALSSIQPGFTVPAGSLLFAVPVAAGAMLVCMVLGFELALSFSLLSAVSAALLFGSRIEIFLFFFIGNAMGAFWVQHCRERRVVITAGAKIGLLNIVMAVGVAIYTTEVGGTALLWNAVMAFAGGMFSGIIALGIAPLVEMAFGYTTDITLLELSNLDRPILRRMLIEVPGTYHHSVIVGTMVEAAAADIGANPLLAKVCGYYHDIGKIKKPHYFIENQTDGRNKHDKLAPSMSSLILISHVKEGVDIARKHKLGQIIIDTIQQHHGTSLIHYFYEKAKQLKGEDAVKIEDYRYPGPKPQTKEVGLVMLADMVEAASRTLENPTPARIRGLVQTLVNKVFSDGQLDNCELTLRDLHSIAKSFNKILNGIHHHRIEYADTAVKESAKVKNGSPDRQSASKPAARDQARRKESPGHLRRLGMS